MTESVKCKSCLQSKDLWCWYVTQAMSAEILKKLQSVITEVSEGVQLKIQIASLKHDWQDDKVPLSLYLE